MCIFSEIYCIIYEANKTSHLTSKLIAFKSISCPKHDVKLQIIFRRLLMKYYVLDGQLRGQAIKERIFGSRAAAEKAMEKILYTEDLQVQDDRFPSKHTEEFVCDQYTRFFVRRVKLA